MSKLPISENLFIDGPSGRLEAVLESPRDGEPRGIAVICHPHPEHGGTMLNKVAHTLARAFVGCEFAALRFNFRGVGQSEGAFAQGAGELEDALAVASSMRKRLGDVSLWLAGFSFGAAIAIQAAADAGADGLVSVAPAVSRVTGRPARQPQCPWLVVQGDADELVALGDTIAWINGLEPGPELRVFPDTEHFFHGKLVELRHAVQEFVGLHLA